jgi:hypothetical protein
MGAPATRPELFRAAQAKIGGPGARKEKNTAMRKLLAVTALSALIVTPAIAQQKTSGNDAAAVRSLASEPSKKAKQSKAAPRQTPSRASPYSTNPEHDVYFRGEYVGSDPDPRIRWTLKNEARRSYGLDN